jgi:flagellar hook-length control protein FliK
MLGAARTNGVSQAQDVDVVQAAPATAPPIATQIADGALMAARRIGQSVEMILQPEGLGSISLRVTSERAGLAVHMAVENPQAREMVQASWPQLQQALEQRGLTVQAMLLDLSNGRGGGQGFQAFQQFNGQQQFTGQQARGGSPNADRRGSPSVASVDEGPRVQSSAAAATRVDYRI